MVSLQVQASFDDLGVKTAPTRFQDPGCLIMGDSEHVPKSCLSAYPVGRQILDFDFDPAYQLWNTTPTPNSGSRSGRS